MITMLFMACVGRASGSPLDHVVWRAQASVKMQLKPSVG